MKTYFLFTLAAIVAACAIVGCGRSNRRTVYPVTATVTFQGKPVADAELVFIHTDASEALRLIAQTDASGVCKPIMLEGEGLPQGTYRVIVQAKSLFDPKNLDAPRPPRLKRPDIPVKYTTEKATPLTCDVEEKENQFTFEL